MMANLKKIGSVVLKILNAFFLVLLVVLLVVLIYLAVGSRSSGLPFLQSFKIFTVMSGSMEPTLNVGGVILVEKVDTSELQEGDIITFLSNDTALNGKVVSHRIIQVVENNNLTMYITKGDANESRDDAAAIPENVIGRVIFHVPYLGYLLNFMKTKQGFFCILLLPCMIILLIETIGLMKNFWAYMDERKALKEQNGEAPEEDKDATESEADKGEAGKKGMETDAPEPSSSEPIAPDREAEASAELPAVFVKEEQPKEDNDL
ncbi:signal peptidase I [Clostridium sp. D33t1_170424_F3]|uniref:signal peptidase I n=1 Tax=Clostridium sp. D33t1_170424_F3 TaxID=2787099 RepID=UPI0018A92182|nr:signal peptidase I [Clostridium sp. D33t1_170424_F3]